MSIVALPPGDKPHGLTPLRLWPGIDSALRRVYNGHGIRPFICWCSPAFEKEEV
jgi:hypothetical protein